LPTGLSLGAVTGIISGTPTKAGVFTFEVKAVDADGLAAIKVLTINAGSTSNTVSITTSSLPSAEVNKAYTTTLAASGGTIPRTWALVGGTLPPGITLAPATGIISGTPTAAGNYDLIFEVTDMDLKSTTQTLSIVVFDPSTGGLVQFTDGTNRITSLGYGNAYKGTYNKKTVTINNTSSTAIAITKISSSSTAFTVSGAPFSIAANGSANLEVSFVPAYAQAYSGTITLTTANGDSYQLAVTGSGLNTNVEIKSGTGVVSYFNALSTRSLPNINKPADFITQAAADFQITGVTPNGTVTVAVTFVSIPENPVFYKVVGNQWIPVSSASVSGNTVTFNITDNSYMDSDPTAGVIRDPIVVGTTGGATGTGTNYAPPSSGGGGGGGGCFIATAAFGSYLDPHVMVLRHFRDNVLLQSELGTEFVKFYYKHSPPIADFIAQHDTLRMIFRFALTPLIFGAEYPLAAGIIFAIGAAWYIRRRLGAKVQKEMLQQV
jgi:hypothetical protein